MDRDKTKTLNTGTDRELTNSLARSHESPSTEQRMLGSEQADPAAPPAPAWHLSGSVCTEPTVPPLEYILERRVTAQFCIAKPVQSRDYRALDKKWLDLHSYPGMTVTAQCCTTKVTCRLKDTANSFCTKVNRKKNPQTISTIEPQEGWKDSQFC